jgi:hypothetical protein
VTVRADVVGGKNLAIDAEESHVIAWRLHGNARAFKQIVLGRNVNPWVHVYFQIG